MAEYVVGVDIGGTFTDCVVVDSAGDITLGKALSSPDDFAIGAVDDIVPIDEMARHIHELAEGMDFTKQAGNG